MDEEVLAHVAELARLNPPQEEHAELTYQFSRIITFVEQLQEVNTDDVPPMSHPGEFPTVWREDKVAPATQADEILANAPSRQERFFTVPKVIK